MKKKFTLIFTLVFITNFKLLSQTNNQDKKFNTSSSELSIPIDSIKAIYNREAVFIDGDGGYIKNGKTYKAGAFFRHLKKELRKSDDAGKEVMIYNRKTRDGFLLYFGGFVGGIAVVIATSNPIGFVLFIPAFIGAVELAQSIKHIHKGIWDYNRDVVIDGANNLTK